MNSMPFIRTALILVSAAILEAGGDALIRRGLQHRPLFLLLGALGLVGYGVLINQGTLSQAPLRANAITSMVRTGKEHPVDARDA